eukprot:8547087-Pyramimonas_sp.AAC.1
MTDPSDAGRAGIFSRRTNRMPHLDLGLVEGELPSPGGVLAGLEIDPAVVLGAVPAKPHPIGPT